MTSNMTAQVRRSTVTHEKRAGPQTIVIRPPRVNTADVLFNSHTLMEMRHPHAPQQAMLDVMATILRITNFECGDSWWRRCSTSVTRCGAFADDIDVYIYGLREEWAATQTEEVIRRVGRDGVATRRFVTANAVTIMARGNVKVQLALSLRVIITNCCITLSWRSVPADHQAPCDMYRTPAEVLFSFDIPACKVLLMGDRNGDVRAFGTATFTQAISTRIVYAEPARFSVTYGLRLLKYHLKGFDVVVPGLVRGAFEHLKGFDVVVPGLVRGHRAFEPQVLTGNVRLPDLVGIDCMVSMSFMAEHLLPVAGMTAHQ
ncbi:hypothetical protein JKP88DRAFT_253267 [Tribonema minus]|uniref:Uncharacterized protein n=1 Tax=Tribonema minus TaxID=303371 RepID=A0A835ZAD1_9STRA|nr:hypothetical protein JKP88DRAFT_253267 [Tribonema minus]